MSINKIIKDLTDDIGSAECPLFDGDIRLAQIGLDPEQKKTSYVLCDIDDEVITRQIDAVYTAARGSNAYAKFLIYTAAQKQAAEAASHIDLTFS